MLRKHGSVRIQLTHTRPLLYVDINIGQTYQIS